MPAAVSLPKKISLPLLQMDAKSGERWLCKKIQLNGAQRIIIVGAIHESPLQVGRNDEAAVQAADGLTTEIRPIFRLRGASR